LEHILLVGVIAGIVSAVLPSIPTTVWMWKERPQYRPVLVACWMFILFLLLFLLWKYWKGRSG